MNENERDNYIEKINNGIISPSTIMVASIGAAYYASTNIAVNSVSDCFMLLGYWLLGIIGIYVFSFLIVTIISAFVGSMNVSEKVINIVIFLTIPIYLFVSNLIKVL